MASAAVDEQVTTGSHPLISSAAAGNVEAEEDTYDSAYDGDSQNSESTSVSSSVFSYVYENGRRYHSNRFNKGKYFLPNDEGEQDRLDLYHHIFLTLLGGKLHHAPLERGNLHHVLDVGTGTGIWAIDMADEYPDAEVIGADISPIQPSWVPSNCRFEVDDAEEEWTYANDYFDYVHFRSLSGSFRDWDAILKQVYDHLKPGGYMEFQDYGMELFFSTGESCAGHDKPMARYFDLITKTAEDMGRPLIIGRTMKDRMLKAGFVNVVEHTAIWPLGEWPKDKRLKELGRWGKAGGLDSVEPFAMLLLCNVAGWSTTDVKEYCVEVKKDLIKGKYYCQGWFVYGQKPACGRSD